MKTMVNYTFKKRIKIIATLILFISVSSCSEDSGPSKDPTQTIPTLTNFSPTSGPKTTLVTINGTNFGVNTTQVFFNNVEAIVESVTATQITANVPTDAGTGLVKVISNGTTLIGQEFTYLISDEQVSTLAGSTQGFTDGTDSDAQFNSPRAIVLDTNGNLYVVDRSNHKIRKVTPSGVVTTLAGSTRGFADGIGSTAQFDFPRGIAIDVNGNLYVADAGNHKIRKIDPSGTVTTVAGSTQGFANGTESLAKFNTPSGITLDAIGNLYVVDTRNYKIRKITSLGVVTTLAGSSQGFADGTGSAAQFNIPSGINLDANGNLYVADTKNHKIRKITSLGVVTTLAGSIQGFADGTESNAQFDNPTSITIDTDGNLYVADNSNHKIRKITPSGVVTTLAGGTQGFTDGTLGVAQFNFPYGITIDTGGILYVADAGNHKIRKITQE